LPEGLSHAIENEKEQDGVGNMKEQVDQMMPPRFQSEKLAIQYVGKPCQWMPIMGMWLGKGPDYALQSKPVLYITVFCYVIVIIK
jgi:hypothetical protein